MLRELKLFSLAVLTLIGGKKLNEQAFETVMCHTSSYFSNCMPLTVLF